MLKRKNNLKEGDKSNIKISSFGFQEKGNFKFEFNEPIELSTGKEPGSSASFSMPITGKGEIKTTGGGEVKLKNPSKKYKFAKIKTNKINDYSHWAKLRIHESNTEQYIDILFGKRGDDIHSHLGFTAEAGSLFIQARKPLITEGRAYYEKGVIVPYERIIEDKTTGRRVKILFSLDINTEKIAVDDFRFYD